MWLCYDKLDWLFFVETSEFIAEVLTVFDQDLKPYLLGTNSSIARNCYRLKKSYDNFPRSRSWNDSEKKIRLKFSNIWTFCGDLGWPLADGNHAIPTRLFKVRLFFKYQVPEWDLYISFNMHWMLTVPSQREIKTLDPSWLPWISTHSSEE